MINAPTTLSEPSLHRDLATIDSELRLVADVSDAVDQQHSRVRVTDIIRLCASALTVLSDYDPTYLMRKIALER